jgi:hypothetical protein
MRITFPHMSSLVRNFPKKILYPFLNNDDTGDDNPNWTNSFLFSSLTSQICMKNMPNSHTSTRTHTLLHNRVRETEPCSINLECRPIQHVSQPYRLRMRVNWQTQHSTRNHDNPAHRSRNQTLYDTSPVWFVFQVTQEDQLSSLMMECYCRSMCVCYVAACRPSQSIHATIWYTEFYQPKTQIGM